MGSGKADQRGHVEICLNAIVQGAMVGKLGVGVIKGNEKVG